MKWLTRSALGLCLCLGALAVIFNVIYYPFHGLAGFERDQYEAAMLRTAEKYAASESLSLGSLSYSVFRSMGGQDDTAYTWGTLSLLGSQGEELHLWLSLKWSPFWKRWERKQCYLLADPRDRILFAESLLQLGNLKRTRYSLENLWREQLRQIKEVWPG